MELTDEDSKTMIISKFYMLEKVKKNMRRKMKNKTSRDKK